MRKGMTGALTAILAILTNKPILGAELNIQDRLQEALFQNRPHIAIRNRFCKSDGTLVLTHVTAPLFKCDFEFRNIRQIGLNTSYSTVIPGPIPETIVREVYIYKNCRNEAVSINDSISLTTIEGNTITRSTSIHDSSSTTSTSSIAFTIPIQAAQVSLGETKQVSFSRQQADSTVYNFSRQVTINQPITFTVPARTIYRVTLQRTVSHAFVRFSGDILIEADVYGGISPVTSNEYNMIPLGALSSFIPDGASRTFRLEGEVWNASASQVERVDTENSILDGETCAPALVGAINRNFDRTITSEYLDLLGSRENVVGMTNSAPGIGSLIMGPLISGMSISTGDVIGNVHVRAKSMGPGFCAVTINGGSGFTQFLAPPGFWSPWTQLFSHIGRSQAIINTTIGCDTGAIFEIRYYR
jgi:hypothetical protein